LGNTRAVFKNDGGNVATLIQANSYYPFGLEMPELSYVGGSGETKYKYNGKEMQDAFSLNWIDYGARFYDPQIGRWHVVDPKAENGYEYSPYNYCFNNPITHIDKDGKWPEFLSSYLMSSYISYKVTQPSSSTPLNRIANTGKSMAPVQKTTTGKDIISVGAEVGLTKKGSKVGVSAGLETAVNSEKGLTMAGIAKIEAFEVVNVGAEIKGYADSKDNLQVESSVDAKINTGISVPSINSDVIVGYGGVSVNISESLRFLKDFYNSSFEFLKTNIDQSINPQNFIDKQ
jgi:RHS repeat-associated protein